MKSPRNKYKSLRLPNKITTVITLAVLILGLVLLGCGSGGGSNGGVSPEIPPPDADNDSIADTIDNCPQIANTDQLDSDNDGIGDACDSATPPSTPGEVQELPPMTSSFTNTTYPMRIYLPAAYDSNNSYPIIFTLDGNHLLYDFIKSIEARNKDVVLVAIENAGERDRDFTLPGARDYFSFLSLELLPFIDSMYSIDASRRTIAGYSLGGLLSGLTLLLEDPSNRRFSGYFAADGSFWNKEDQWQALEQQLADQTNSVPGTLFISGRQGTNGNDLYVRNFRDSLQQRNFQDLTIAYQAYPISHDDSARPFIDFVVSSMFP